MTRHEALEAFEGELGRITELFPELEPEVAPLREKIGVMIDLGQHEPAEWTPGGPCPSCGAPHGTDCPHTEWLGADGLTRSERQHEAVTVPADNRPSHRVPGYNVDRINYEYGIEQAAEFGYFGPRCEMVITYALQRHARGEEEAAQKMALEYGINLTSWYGILAAAMAAADNE